jgi:hypothetical protein
MIDEHRGSFGVEPICRMLQIAPSTYYAVKAREVSVAPRSGAAHRYGWWPRAPTNSRRSVAMCGCPTLASRVRSRCWC